MKWLALVLILLLIVIVFGVWRRLQADHARRAGAVPPNRAIIEPPAASQGAATTSSTATTTPAAEAGADEVPWSPAHEEHRGAADSTSRPGTESRSPSAASPPADPWWGDDDAPDKPT